jgi:hypothetical protein
MDLARSPFRMGHATELAFHLAHSHTPSPFEVSHAENGRIGEWQKPKSMVKFGRRLAECLFLLFEDENSNHISRRLLDI